MSHLSKIHFRFLVALFRIKTKTFRAISPPIGLFCVIGLSTQFLANVKFYLESLEIMTNEKTNLLYDSSMCINFTHDVKFTKPAVRRQN